MLGHANISQTMDIYSHVLPNMQDEAAAAMESALTKRVGIRLASKSLECVRGSLSSLRLPCKYVQKRSGETRNRTGDTMILSLGRYGSGCY
jgi:hypothetical protein